MFPRRFTNLHHFKEPSGHGWYFEDNGTRLTSSAAYAIRLNRNRVQLTRMFFILDLPKMFFILDLPKMMNVS